MRAEVYLEPITDGQGRKNPWYFLIAAITAFIFLFFALRSVDWAKVWETFTGVQWWYVALGTSFTCLAHFQRSLRWRVLLAAKTRFSVSTVFHASMAGYLSNNLLPARAGEVVRTVLICKHSSLSKTFVLTTAIAERLIDAIALALVSSVALLSLESKPEWMTHLARIMALISVGGFAVAIFLPHSRAFWDIVISHSPLSGYWKGKLSYLTTQVLAGVDSIRDWRRFGAFSMLTAVVWFSDLLATVIGGKALGLNISLPVAVLWITGLGLGSALPSTPGNLGLYPFVAVSIFPLFGISRNGAIAFSLMSQVMGYLVIVALTLLLSLVQGFNSTRNNSKLAVGDGS